MGARADDHRVMVDAPGDWTRDQVVPAGGVLARLDQAFGLVAPSPGPGAAPRPSATATRTAAARSG